jgi:hypothetical protein
MLIWRAEGAEVVDMDLMGVLVAQMTWRWVKEGAGAGGAMYFMVVTRPGHFQLAEG